MYHGTRAENGDFHVFDYSKAVKKGGLGMKALGVGNYFTATRLSGNERYGSRVIEAYLSIKQPFEIYTGETFKEAVQNKMGLDTKEMSYDAIQQAMKEHGYDGVIQRGKDGNVALAVTFSSEQIKSATDNVGLFAPENPGYSLCPQPEPVRRQSHPRGGQPLRRNPQGHGQRRGHQPPTGGGSEPPI